MIRYAVFWTVNGQHDVPCGVICAGANALSID